MQSLFLNALRSDIGVLLYKSESIANGGPSVGAKRSALLAASKADYVSFVDDDDVLSSDYCEAIYKRLNHYLLNGAKVDLVVFDVMVYGFGDPKVCKYSPTFQKDSNEPDRYCRLPNHLMVWKRELCLPFNDVSMGEDSAWAKEMLKANPAPSTIAFDKVLYEYRRDVTDSVSAGTAR